MRNIEFRGYDPEAKKFRYGFYNWSMGRHYITEIVNELPSLSDPGGTYIENSYEVDWDSIGQFTGVLTQNCHAKIFEGDICESKSGARSFVIFMRDGFRMNGFFDGPTSVSECVEKCGLKIIGNMTENPDLLK